MLRYVDGRFSIVSTVNTVMSCDEERRPVEEFMRKKFTFAISSPMSFFHCEHFVVCRYLWVHWLCRCLWTFSAAYWC